MRTVNHLNHGDPSHLLRHCHLISSNCGHNAIELIRLVRWKEENDPKRFGRPGQFYAAYMTILILSGHPDAPRVARCMVGQRRCGKWKLCCHCAWVRKMEFQKRFALRLGHAAGWYLSTLSFKGRLILRPDSSRFYPPTVFWDTCRHAVKTLVEEKLVNGAIWVEELAICSFVTQKVVAHMHVMFDAENLGLDFLKRLHTLLREYREPVVSDSETEDGTLDGSEQVESCSRAELRAGRVDPLLAGLGGQPEVGIIETLGFEASTRTRFVGAGEDEEARYNAQQAFSYLLKPVDLVTPYMVGIGEIDQSTELERFNTNKEEVLDGLALFTARRWQVGYLGSLNASSERYVGLGKKERDTRSHYNETVALLRHDNEAAFVARMGQSGHQNPSVYLEDEFKAELEEWVKSLRRVAAASTPAAVAGIPVPKSISEIRFEVEQIVKNSTDGQTSSAADLLSYGAEFLNLKRTVGHGHWSQMFAADFSSRRLRTIQRLMRLARRFDGLDRQILSFLPRTVSGLEALSKHEDKAIALAVLHRLIDPKSKVPKLRRLAETLKENGLPSS